MLCVVPCVHVSDWVILEGSWRSVRSCLDSGIWPVWDCICVLDGRNKIHYKYWKIDYTPLHESILWWVEQFKAVGLEQGRSSCLPFTWLCKVEAWVSFTVSCSEHLPLILFLPSTTHAAFCWSDTILRAPADWPFTISPLLVWCVCTHPHVLSTTHSMYKMFTVSLSYGETAFLFVYWFSQNKFLRCFSFLEIPSYSMHSAYT